MSNNGNDFVIEGSFLDQKSVMFQEEFPQLPFGSEEKILMPRKEDESREASHGPGLNLRPQSMGNILVFPILDMLVIAASTSCFAK